MHSYKDESWAWAWSSVVEYLPSMCNALNTTKQKEKKKRGRGVVIWLLTTLAINSSHVFTSIVILEAVGELSDTASV